MITNSSAKSVSTLPRSSWKAIITHPTTGSMRCEPAFETMSEPSMWKRPNSSRYRGVLNDAQSNSSRPRGVDRREPGHLSQGDAIRPMDQPCDLFPRDLVALWSRVGDRPARNAELQEGAAYSNQHLHHQQPKTSDPFRPPLLLHL